jgi:tetratricopeptide (TPR) repeat protein
VSVPRDVPVKTRPGPALVLMGLGCLIGLLLLAASEAGLALLGIADAERYEDPFVGFEPGQSLFEMRQDGEGRASYVTRETKRRFFNRQSFPATKPLGTFRVFTLGGSTTYGRPYDDRVSFSSWLRLLLAREDPSRAYEVVNAGGVSYASYRLVVLMKELVRYEPDLFVVYTGHNEFLEERTYADIIHEPPAQRALRRWLHKLRTARLLRRVLSRRDDRDRPASTLEAEVKTKLDVWAGLDAFSRDESRRRAILEHYRFNLQQMIDLARAHDVEILFVGPVSNLKDSSPFKSEHAASLAPEARRGFEASYERGRDLLAQGDGPEALGHLVEAVELSSEHADAHYRLGRCSLGLGDLERAEHHLGLALELDVCPLRAPREVRVSLQETTRRNRVALIDLPRILEEDSQARHGHRLLGNEYFLDHVHPRIEIHQRIAEEILGALAELGLVPLVGALTAEQRHEIYETFLQELDPSYYAQRDANLGKVLGWAGKTAEAAEALRRAARARPDDPEVLYNLAVAYQKSGQADRAVEPYRRVIELRPDFPEARFNLGKSLQALGAWAEAAAAFEEALRRAPGDAKTHYGLAQCLRELGRFADELAELEKARDANPELPDIDRLLGSVYAREGRPEPARLAYLRHLARNPDDHLGHSDLGDLYRDLGRWDEARAAYQRSVALRPDFAPGHANLGAIYARKGSFDDAIGSLETALRLNPELGGAHYHLASIFYSRGELARAGPHFRRAQERGVPVPAAVLERVRPFMK